MINKLSENKNKDDEKLDQVRLSSPDGETVKPIDIPSTSKNSKLIIMYMHYGLFLLFRLNLNEYEYYVKEL